MKEAAVACSLRRRASTHASGGACSFSTSLDLIYSGDAAQRNTAQTRRDERTPNHAHTGLHVRDDKRRALRADEDSELRAAA